MKVKHFLLFFILLFFKTSAFGQFSTSGGIGNTPYKYQENLIGTGIQAVYFYNTFSGAVLEYKTDAAIVKFFKYTHSLNDRQQIADSDISTNSTGKTTTYTIQNLEDSRGYYAEINGSVTAAIWVIDYNKHLPILNSIEPVESDDRCEYLKLLVNKDDELLFYANNGSANRIIRKYEIEYYNLVWDEKAKQFNETTITTRAAEIGTEIVIDAPLINTTFKLSGDQIAQAFSIEKSIQSKVYTAVAIEAHIIAEQVKETGTTNDIGGSAPADVNFYGYGNEPASTYYTWHIYKKTDLDNALVRYTDKDISYTFKESGEYHVVLEIANGSSTCPTTASIDLSITEFSWEIPNFLLLDGTREFKISYKSIVKFKCTIFNRWGNKLYEWTDPSKGWDGKYKGKYVNPGVYFYMMTAISGDGRKHEKAGDINVLRSK